MPGRIELSGNMYPDFLSAHANFILKTLLALGVGLAITGLL